MITQDESTRAEPRDPFLGRTFDGYRIEEMIGKGGMGVVYKATQLSLDRPVAIKLLPETVSEHPQFVKRFEREVDVLSKLAHPNIVTVLERGEIDGQPYLVMEYVAGTSLREVLKEGPLPATEALVIVRSVLSALEHAHDKGVIHRDIKPENILVAPGGIVKVADFGLGRVLGGSIDTTRLTHTHLLLGTFEYMSPEQREKSKEADARTDLYATGVILYELVAGELPIGHFAPLSLKNPQECDNRIDGVVRRSLQKEPDERYQRASEMGADVSQLLSTPPVPELGARVTRAATVIEEGAIETPSPDGTTVEDGAIATPRPLPAATEHTRGRVPWWLVMAPAAVVLAFVVPKFLSVGKGASVAVWPLIAVVTAMVIGGLAIWRWGGERARPPRATTPHAQPAANGPSPQPTSMAGKLFLATGIVIAYALFFGFMGAFDEDPSPIVLSVLAVAVGFALYLVFRPQRPRRVAMETKAHRTPPPDWHLGLAVTALWVGIVLVATGGFSGMRDEHVMWLCIGAVASVFLVPKLKHIARAGAFLLITFGVLLIPLVFFFFAIGGEPEVAPTGLSKTAFHKSAPIAHMYDAVPLELVREILADSGVRQWLVAYAFHDADDLGRTQVTLSGQLVYLQMRGNRFRAMGYADLACAAVATVLEAATDGRIRNDLLRKGAGRMLKSAPPPPVEKFKRMLPEKPG